MREVPEGLDHKIDTTKFIEASKPWEQRTYEAVIRIEKMITDFIRARQAERAQASAQTPRKK